MKNSDKTSDTPPKLPGHLLWLLKLSKSVTMHDRQNAQTTICALMQAEARLAAARRAAIEKECECRHWKRSTRSQAAWERL